MTTPLENPTAADADPGEGAGVQVGADAEPGEGTGAQVGADAEPGEGTGAQVGAGFVGRVAAGYSVQAQLGELLEPVFAEEPPFGDAIPAIFRRAEKLRRRRSRTVVLAAAVVVMLVFTLGYGVTRFLLPITPDRVATPAGRSPPDEMLAVFAAVLAPSGLRVVARTPTGVGWRQYLVLTAGGQPHGLIEASVYAARPALCFPVLADKKACARPERAADQVEYVRYAFDQDVDWQVNEVIARRSPDGRTVVVQATGERGTGSATGGRPPLTALLAATTATDPRVAAAFGAYETCTGPNRACPVLKVPVPEID